MPPFSPDTITRPKDDRKVRSDDISWTAPIEAVMPETAVKVKDSGCPECEYITNGDMSDRRAAKENPNIAGKCKECATHWCSASYSDEYSDSGKCGFRVCEKHWKIMTKNGKQHTTSIGSHSFGGSGGNYDTTRRASDYDDNQQFNEERYKKRTKGKKK